MAPHRARRWDAALPVPPQDGHRCAQGDSRVQPWPQGAQRWPGRGPEVLGPAPDTGQEVAWPAGTGLQRPDGASDSAHLGQARAGRRAAVDMDRPASPGCPPQPPLQRTACGPPAWLRFLDTPTPWEAARPPTPFQDPGPLPDPGREHGSDPDTQGQDRDYSGKKRGGESIFSLLFFSSIKRIKTQLCTLFFFSVAAWPYFSGRWAAPFLSCPGCLPSTWSYEGGLRSVLHLRSIRLPGALSHKGRINR